MKLKYKRISLKLSGEAVGSECKAVDFEVIEKIAWEIKLLYDAGVEVGVTMGGGNIWRGGTAVGMERTRADEMGMLATVINSIALEAMLKKLSVPCIILSNVPMERICSTFTPERAEEAFQAGKVVLFAAGSGLAYFTTDTSAAIKAAEIHADVLMLAKNVDGVYTCDPRSDANAVKLDHLCYDEVVHRGLRATDLTAITFCKDNSIPILVFAMRETGSILKAAAGECPGTLID